MKKVGKSSSSKPKGGFVYKKRSVDDVKARAERTGGRFDSPIIDRIDSFRPKVGENMIRIMPPTWDEPEHYGYQVWVHTYIGPDSSNYLCPRKMKGDPCPICEESARAKAAGENDEAKLLEVKEQFWCWVIDRDDDEKEGVPKIFILSWTADRDIAALCYSARTKKIRLIDHPDEGYDLIIKRTGQGLKTRYQYQIDYDSTPLHDDQDTQDDLLAYIQEHPVPSVLKYYDADYLEKVLVGEVKQKDPDSEDDDDGGGDADEPRGRRRRSRSSDDDDGEDEAPRRRRKPRDEDADEDEDEDEAPRQRRRSRDEDEDEGEDAGDSDPEEDEAPRRRRRSRDEDDDEDEGKEEAPRRRRSRGDEDEGDGEEERPRRRRSRGDDDDEDEDKDEAPRRRRRGSRDEDEDEAGGAEEEERPRRRRSRS